MRLKWLCIQWLCGVAVAGSALSDSVTPVQTRPPVQAPDPASERFWNGYYAGISVGAADGYLSASGELLGNSYVASDDASGGLLGVHVGRLWQIQRPVFGAEFSYSLSNIDYSGAVLPPPPPPSPPPPSSPTTQANRSFDLDYLAELRALAGYEVRPSLLVYASAGLAFGSSTTEFVFNSEGSSSRASDDNSRFGWSAGLGIATRIGNASFIRGEVSYVDLGTERYVIDDGLGNTADIRQGLDFARITIGYSWMF